MSKSSLRVHLEGLYKLHLVSERMEHAVRREQNSDWEPYEPSRFVYAFFTFNALYSLDWKTSRNEYRVQEWHRTEESKKIKKAVDFCFDDQATLDMFMDGLNERLQKLNPEEALSEIREAGRVEKCHIRNFETFVNRCREKNLTTLEKDLGVIKGGLKFIYLVRCNIFHGFKTTVMMLEREQRNRLLVYATILEVFNRTLLEEAERLGMWKRASDKAYISEL